MLYIVNLIEYRPSVSDLSLRTVDEFEFININNDVRLKSEYDVTKVIFLCQFSRLITLKQNFAGKSCKREVILFGIISFVFNTLKCFINGNFSRFGENNLF